MSTDDTKRALRNLKNMLTRRARYIPVPGAFECVGGPYDGETLRLQDAATGFFSVGSWTGRYHQVSDQGYYHQRRHGLPSIVWEAS
jgi:hypothetical protein